MGLSDEPDPWAFLIEDRNNPPVDPFALEEDIFGLCNDPLEASQSLQAQASSSKPPSTLTPGFHPHTSSRTTEQYNNGLIDFGDDAFWNGDLSSCHFECCDDTCPPLTVTCTDAECNRPNRCEEVCGTCNDTGCEEEPCTDSSCPLSFQHFDVCFEPDCAPSPDAGPCSSAPCTLNNCGGTYITNTCLESSHQGWDPGCAQSTLHPAVLHDLGTQSWLDFHETPHVHTNAPDLSNWVHPSHLQNDWHYENSVPSLSPVASSLSAPTPAFEFSLINQTDSRLSHYGQAAPAASSASILPRKRTEKYDRAPKRLRIQEPAREPSSTPESTVQENVSPSRHSTFTPTPLSAGGTPSASQPCICQWVLHPSDPPSSHQLCNFPAFSGNELHNHILKAHTQHLNSAKGFICHWLGCSRFASASYGQKSKLNRHVQTHSHFLPYACSFTGAPHFCAKRFSTNDQRRNHEATHTEDRRYQCNICGARFKHATSLSTHKFTHTGEKPYKCWICGKAEGDPSNRSKHVKKEHPGWPRVRPADWDDERVERERVVRGMVGVKDDGVIEL